MLWRWRDVPPYDPPEPECERTVTKELPDPYEGGDCAHRWARLGQAKEWRRGATCWHERCEECGLERVWCEDDEPDGAGIQETCAEYTGWHEDEDEPDGDEGGGGP